MHAGHLAITSDRERIAQVFANLLGKVIAYAPGGEIRVLVWSDGPSAHVSVADCGPGIPPDSLETIFEPGVRLRARTSSRGPAEAGLGLSIVREIVDAHGGLRAHPAKDGCSEWCCLCARRHTCRRQSEAGESDPSTS